MEWFLLFAGTRHFRGRGETGLDWAGDRHACRLVCWWWVGLGIFVVVVDRGTGRWGGLGGLGSDMVLCA